MSFHQILYQYEGTNKDFVSKKGPITANFSQYIFDYYILECYRGQLSDVTNQVYIHWFGLVWLFMLVLFACLLAELIRQQLRVDRHKKHLPQTPKYTLNPLNCCLTKDVVRRPIGKYMQEQGRNRTIRNLLENMNKQKLPF